LPDGSRDILGIWIEQTEGAKQCVCVASSASRPRCGPGRTSPRSSPALLVSAPSFLL
jgi:hypothetical protein